MVHVQLPSALHRSWVAAQQLSPSSAPLSRCTRRSEFKSTAALEQIPGARSQNELQFKASQTTRPTEVTDGLRLEKILSNLTCSKSVLLCLQLKYHRKKPLSTERGRDL